MAISQMQKISLVFPKDSLDSLLLTLQKMQGVELRQLREIEDWQEALEAKDLLSLHPEASADGQEGLSYQKELESLIAQLSQHLPKVSTLKALKQAKKTLSFDELEAYGRGGQGQAVLSYVREQLQSLKHLEEQGQACQDKIDQLSKWRSLEVTPNRLRQFSHVKARVGSIPSSNQDNFIKAIEANPDLAFEKVYSSETEYGLIVLASADMEDLTNHLFEEYEFKPFLYNRDDLPSDYLKLLAIEQETYDRERRNLLKTLQASYDKLEQLQLELDYHLNHQARKDSHSALASTDNLTALEGWIEADQVPILRQHLERDFGQELMMTLSDVAESDLDAVPIRLKNHALIEPFELITEMYALPKYQEKDPTPFLAPFYFTFFGMMVADLGYGLVLFLATAVALKIFHLDRGAARFLRFFNLLGISVSLWGLIYGSFLGFDLPVRLLSPANDVIAILGLSVAFGFVTMLTGLLLGGFQQIRVKDYAQAYTSGFAWVMILVGVALVAAGQFIPSLAELATVGKFLALANALGILVVSVIASKSLAGLGAGLFNLYNVSSYFGDLVSFTRLMALGMSGASIGSAFNTIVGILPVWARFSIGILLFLVLHLVNMLLSLLSGYVHGARLIFVEFFGKFYEGGGRAFAPLKPAEKYVTITKEVHLEDK